MVNINAIIIKCAQAKMRYQDLQRQMGQERLEQLYEDPRYSAMLPPKPVASGKPFGVGDVFQGIENIQKKVSPVANFLLHGWGRGPVDVSRPSELMG